VDARTFHENICIKINRRTKNSSKNSVQILRNCEFQQVCSGAYRQNSEIFFFAPKVIDDILRLCYNQLRKQISETCSKKGGSKGENCPRVPERAPGCGFTGAFGMTKGATM
jgi:hypothetical protein